jgi:hypothetical protein
MCLLGRFIDSYMHLQRMCSFLISVAGPLPHRQEPQSSPSIFSKDRMMYRISEFWSLRHEQYVPMWETIHDRSALQTSIRHECDRSTVFNTGNPEFLLRQGVRTVSLASPHDPETLYWGHVLAVTLSRLACVCNQALLALYSLHVSINDSR